MKNRKHWFAGLAFALPVAVLLVVLGSMQPASAHVDTPALPHEFYGGVEYLDGSLAPAGTVIHAEDDEGLDRVYFGIFGNPLTTTVEGLFGGSGVFDAKLVVQGDVDKMETGMPIAFYVDGERAEVQECDTTEPDTWYTSWPWFSTGETCLNMKAAPSERYTMTVTAGECCTVTVDGVPIAPNDTVSFPDIGSAVLEAITGTCCNFVQWTVDGTDIITANPTTIVLTEDLAVEATCEVPTFTLTTHVDPVGSGDVLQNPDPPYVCGTAVTVTAERASADWRFVEWSGALTGAVNPNTIEMYSNEVVTAHFVPSTHPLTVTSLGCRPISVTYDTTVDVVAAGDFATYVISHGLTVTLDVLDAECCVFDEWQVDGAPVAGDPIEVLVDADHTAVAVSHGPPFTLTLLTAGRGGGTVEGAGFYTPCHTMATITATADEHSVFAGWSGDLVTTTNPATIEMDGDKTVMATFNLVTYTMTISDSVPPEGGDVEIEEEWPDPEGEYEYGETITVTAVPSYCYEFVGWGGDLEGSPNPAVFTVTENLAFGAIFQLQTHTLDVVVDPAGRGNVTLDPPGGVYSCCTWVTMTAVPVDNWQFVEWSSGGTATETVIHIGEEDQVVTATFALETFIVTFPPVEGGEVVPDPEQPSEGYDYGQAVTLTAVPTTCYEFVEWTGLPDGVPTDTETVVITVTEEMTITAIFQLQTHTLDVVVDPAGRGNVTLDPPGGVYSCCTWVTMTAVPVDNWQFVEWSSGGTATETVIHIGEEDQVVTATFALETFIVTFPPVEGGEVVPDPVQPPEGYDYGTVVTLTAVPTTCYEFVEWTGLPDGVPTDTEPVVITVTEEMTITAIFQLQTHTLDVVVDPLGGGSVTLNPPGGVYTCCTTVNLTAVPVNQDWEFVEWSGAASGTLTQTSVHIGEEDQVVTATFYSDIPQTYYTLTVATAGGGNGTVDPDVGTYSYLSGTVVLMTADPDDPDSYFAGWSGALTGTDLTGNITMDSDKEVTATFEISGVVEYVLTVTSDGCCSISVEYDTTVETVAAGDSKQFTPGEDVVVTLTAIPADELCGFDGWRVDGGDVTMDNSITVTMDDDHIAVATCTRHFIFLPVVARNYSP